MDESSPPGPGRARPRSLMIGEGSRVKRFGPSVAPGARTKETIVHDRQSSHDRGKTGSRRFARANRSDMVLGEVDLIGERS